MENLNLSGGEAYHYHCQVVYIEEACSLGGVLTSDKGTVKVNAVPFPTPSLATVRVPAISLAKWALLLKPNPCPSLPLAAH